MKINQWKQILKVVGNKPLKVGSWWNSFDDNQKKAFQEIYYSAKYPDIQAMRKMFTKAKKTFGTVKYISQHSIEHKGKEYQYSKDTDKWLYWSPKGKVLYHTEINSSYFKTLQLGDYVIQIFKNPDRGEIDELIKKYDGIRGIIDADNNNVYVWSQSIADVTEGNEVEHEYVIRKMSWGSKRFIPIILQKNGWVDFSSWYYKNSKLYKEGVTDVSKYILKNKNLKAIGYNKFHEDYPE